MARHLLKVQPEKIKVKISEPSFQVKRAMKRRNMMLKCSIQPKILTVKQKKENNKKKQLKLEKLIKRVKIKQHTFCGFRALNFTFHLHEDHQKPEIRLTLGKISRSHFQMGQGAPALDFPVLFLNLSVHDLLRKLVLVRPKCVKTKA